MHSINCFYSFFLLVTLNSKTSRHSEFKKKLLFFSEKQGTKLLQSEAANNSETNTPSMQFKKYWFITFQRRPKGLSRREA